MGPLCKEKKISFNSALERNMKPTPATHEQKKIKNYNKWVCSSLSFLGQEDHFCAQSVAKVNSITKRPKILSFCSMQIRISFKGLKKNYGDPAVPMYNNEYWGFSSHRS